MTIFRNTVQLYQPGAHTLPGEYFTSAEIFAEERQKIFAQSWCYAGYASQLARPGDYFLREIAGESLIVLRDSDGRLRAFFNVCRHRGTRLCREAAGHFSGSIQCPYHAWTYATSGQLLGAPQLQGVAGFDKKDFPLHAAAIAECEGFIFVNLEKAPLPFAQALAQMGERFTRFKLGGLQVGHSVKYEVPANWKLIIQNYSECLHCPVIHPKLNSMLPHKSGGNDLVEGPFLGGYLDLAAPYRSVTMSGEACGRLLNPGASEADQARAFFYTVMPNLMLDIYPDYASTYLITPLAVDRTLVEFELLFVPPAAGEPQWNRQDAIEMSEMTNRQDWETLALCQQGVASRYYQPGPYSPPESMTLAWDRHYLQLLGR